MGVYEFLFGEKEKLIRILETELEELHRLVIDFRKYIDSYHKKLKIIHDFLREGKDFALFKNELRHLHKLIIADIKNEVDSERQLLRLFDGFKRIKTKFDSREIKEIESKLQHLRIIIKLIRRYVLLQEKYIEKYDDEENFRIHIEELMKYINEEASILFCNVIKDSFEFMDAPEKGILIELNKEFHKLLEEVTFEEDLAQLERDSIAIIGSSRTAFELFRNLIILLRRTTKIRCIQLLVVDPSLKRIEVTLYSYVKHLPMYDIAHEGGIIADSIRRKSPICVNSVFEDNRYDIFDATIKSELVVPILLNGGVYGVLNFEDEHLERFSRDFLHAIQTICSLISERLPQFQDKYLLKRMAV